MPAKSPPLYKLLDIQLARMPDVWDLVDQYPPTNMAWYPHAKPSRDAQLLRLRYTTTGEVQASLRDLARAQQLTPERVRVRLNRIITWLREQFSHNGIPGI